MDVTIVNIGAWANYEVSYRRWRDAPTLALIVQGSGRGRTRVIQWDLLQMHPDLAARRFPLAVTDAITGMILDLWNSYEGRIPSNAQHFILGTVGRFRVPTDAADSIAVRVKALLETVDQYEGARVGMWWAQD